MKRIARYLLVFSLIIVLCSANGINAHAANVTSGFCGGEDNGTNLTWNLNTEGLLTISGTGSMKGYRIDSRAPWSAYSNQIKCIEIQNGVTSIGTYAFRDLKNLECIQIADSVVKIYNLVFINCSSLKSIIIPDSVTFLGSQCFQGCTNLTEVVLSKNLSELSDYLFYECRNLTKILIPSSVTYMSSGVFADCSSLREIWFCGDAPEKSISFNVFIPQSAKAVVHYPGYNLSWTPEIIKSFPGWFSWVAEYPSISTSVNRKNDNLFATVKIEKNSDQDFSCWVICAAYNSDGKMIAIEPFDVSMSNIESKEYSILLSNKDSSKIDLVKYFFLNKQSNCIPITQCHSIPIKTLAEK